MNPNVAGREAKEAASAPAYCELFNQLDLRSHAGLDANAAVTDNGRVDISINQKSKRLSQLLEPTIRSQLQPNTRRSSSSPAQGPVPPPYIPSSLGGQAGQTPPPKLNVVIQIVSIDLDCHLLYRATADMTLHLGRLAG